MTEAEVTLTGEDVLRARRAVAALLNHERREYVAATRRGNQTHARFSLERWYAYADLFDRLGGDVNSLHDPRFSLERWYAYADLFDRLGGDVNSLHDPETAAEQAQVTT